MGAAAAVPAVPRKFRRERFFRKFIRRYPLFRRPDWERGRQPALRLPSCTTTHHLQAHLRAEQVPDVCYGRLLPVFSHMIESTYDPAVIGRCAKGCAKICRRGGAGGPSSAHFEQHGIRENGHAARAAGRTFGNIAANRLASMPLLRRRWVREAISSRRSTPACGFGLPAAGKAR